jgi:plastocyanin
MGLRRYAFLLVCALLGAAVAVLPAAAGSETTPTVSAEPTTKPCGTYYPHCWSPSTVELAAPGTVAFQNASGTPHGVVWSSVPVTPTCTGVPVGGSFSANFSGTCSFPQTGTYSFYCSYHGSAMSGAITVAPTGTTTTTTTATQPGGTTTSATTQPMGTASTPSGAPGSNPSQQTASAGASVSLARSQRGKAVHGSLDVPAADAGGRLEVDLLAKRAALAATSGSSAVRVGRLVRSSLRAGRLSFTVTLDAKARSRLSHRRRLVLIVRVVLTPPHGPPSVTSRNVLLRA